MFNLNVPIVINQPGLKPRMEYRKETVYSVNDFPFSDIFEYKTYKGSRNKVEYIDLCCAYDIETTTIMPKSEDEAPFGFMYHWQFAIEEYVCFGRTWEEWEFFMDRIRESFGLGEKRKLVVYVHFLSFEFQFMNQFLPDMRIFATDKRKVLTVESRGIEFRCSYRFSNMSLEKFCESCEGVIHYKQKAKDDKERQHFENYIDLPDYDYKKVRTPNTPLEEYEMSYCYNDVAGLVECIRSFVKEEHICTLPLTSTGFVRRDIVRACQSYNYRKKFLNYEIDVDMYRLLRDMFRGGNCHLNALYTDEVLIDVYSFDKQSSYPATIMMDYFPMGRITKISNPTVEQLYNYMSRYCCMMEIEFFGLKSKEFIPCPYIDFGHCSRKHNVTLDNGRVVNADYIKYALTELDFEIIDRQYTWDSMVITKMYVSHRGRLPDEVRTTMMEYFFNKCTLKGVLEAFYFYVKSKNKLNSFYGMMVTAIAHIIWEYEKDTLEWTDEEEDVRKALEDFFMSRKSCLAYQWGIYVTSHGRYNLQEGIDCLDNLLDYVYGDTDCVKFLREINIKNFEKLNQKIIDKCENNDIPAYVDYNGKRYYLGLWEMESKIKRFKSFGAKKYACEFENGEFEITVSGMGKEEGSKAVGCIENFELGRTYKNVHRTVSYYNDEPRHQITVDGCTFTTGSNIGVVDTTYTLGITGDYAEYYNKVKFEGISKIS